MSKREDPSPGMAREKRTIEVMVKMYCSSHHAANKSLCRECGDLLSYALQRLLKCPFGEKKRACSKCKIHCYEPSMRQKITSVMRYAGPRMISRHPVLALAHGIKSL